jgi:hypothetical protein
MGCLRPAPGSFPSLAWHEKERCLSTASVTLSTSCGPNARGDTTGWSHNVEAVTGSRHVIAGRERRPTRTPAPATTDGLWSHRAPTAVLSVTSGSAVYCVGQSRTTRRRSHGAGRGVATGRRAGVVICARIARDPATGARRGRGRQLHRVVRLRRLRVRRDGGSRRCSSPRRTRSCPCSPPSPCSASGSGSAHSAGCSSATSATATGAATPSS